LPGFCLPGKVDSGPLFSVWVFSEIDSKFLHPSFLNQTEIDPEIEIRR